MAISPVGSVDMWRFYVNAAQHRATVTEAQDEDAQRDLLVASAGLKKALSAEETNYQITEAQKSAEANGFGVESGQKGNSLEQDGMSNTLESNKGVNVDVYA